MYPRVALMKENGGRSSILAVRTRDGSVMGQTVLTRCGLGVYSQMEAHGKMHELRGIWRGDRGHGVQWCQ